jgi:ATP-dependent helicase/DNAse subunit B
VSKYKDKLDKMTWSFSRLHLYETCPYAFYLKYIEEVTGDDNYFAENGSLMHETIMNVLKGELGLNDAPAYYIDEYENIYSKTKTSTMENTFNKCLDYLCTTEGLNIERYEIIWVEGKILFNILKYNFTGYPDLILKDKTTDEIILVDHKSLDYFFKKDGKTVLKNQLESFSAYRHQMYMYCKWIYEKYGKFPSKIIWNHFKDEGKLSIITFDKKDYDETLDWATKTIKKIYRDSKFKENKSYMQDYVLCEFRYSCEYKNEDTKEGD